MDKKKDLLKLDFYEILNIPPNSDVSQIKKAFRKNAVLCHPDKNPDNPDAAQKFIQLKDILEILLDADNKTSYDKLLRGRKEAEIRARNFSAKTQSLTAQLEKREREAEKAKHQRKQEIEREELRRRINAENRRLIEEDLAAVEKELMEQAKQECQPPPKEAESNFRVKAKWKKTADWDGFSKEDTQRIFYKWGEMNALVMTEKGSKVTALIEYAEQSAAEMAVAYEIGLPGKEIKVSYVSKPKDKKKEKKGLIKSTDTESVYERNQRVEEERKKLIEMMRRKDNL